MIIGRRDSALHGLFVRDNRGKQLNIRDASRHNISLRLAESRMIFLGTTRGTREYF